MTHDLLCHQEIFTEGNICSGLLVKSSHLFGAVVNQFEFTLIQSNSVQLKSNFFLCSSVFITNTGGKMKEMT